MGLKDAADNHTDECGHLLRSSSEPIDTTGWTSCLDNSQFLTECSNMFSDSKSIVTDSDVKDIFATSDNQPIIFMETDKASPPNICDNEKLQMDFCKNYFREREHQTSHIAQERVNVEVSPSILVTKNDDHSNVKSPTDFCNKYLREHQQTANIANERVNAEMTPKVKGNTPGESNSKDSCRKFSFRSAREELSVQSAKKPCNNSNGSSSTSQQQQPFFMYGAGRASGRRTKFVSPMQQTE